jgi:ATP-dependent RNA helicase DeaD
MASFEDLGLRPELVEGLAAEGIERPTILQQEAIPALRKGNSALVRGGPGAGVLVAWAAPLLDRLEPVAGGPVLLALVPSRAIALDTARALGRIAASAGHRVAALGGPYALPGHADVLVATPEELAAAIAATDVATGGVEAVVMAGAAALLEEAGQREFAEHILDALEAGELQRIVVSDPVTPAVRSFVDAHLSRAIFLPSDAGGTDEAEEAPVQRGTLRTRILEGEEGVELPRLVGDLMEEGHRHLLLFFRSEDRAADLGDLLTLHGYGAGEPGDPEVPVWLATDGMEARRSLGEALTPDSGILAVSVDAPPDADELDRRHGGGVGGGVVLSRAREVAHLRRITRQAGYALHPFPPPAERESPAARFASSLAPVIEDADLDPYHLLLEPAIERWGATEVAAALAFLLRQKGQMPRAGQAGGVGASPDGSAGAPGAPSAFVRLFLSVGSRDGIGPGELLGAITGETGIKGERIGRIDVRDTFSRVEVDEPVAADIIRAMNGITIKGRSVRADYDRQAGRGGDGPPPPDRGRGGGAGSGPPRGQSGRGGPSRGGSGPSRGGSGPSRGGSGPSRGSSGPSRGGEGRPRGGSSSRD